MLEKTKKYAVGIWALKGSADRFVSEGYEREFLGTGEGILKASQIKGIKVLEFMSSDFDNFSVAHCKSLLEKNGLETLGILANTFSRKWKLGAFSNTDETLRKSAIKEGIRAVEIATELNCDNITLWLGSDGFDYPFQVDYKKHWDLLMKSINELVDAYPDKRFALEYKLKEPRKHLTIGTAMKALYIVQKLKKDNLGVLIDFGHALMAKENVAETVSILSEEGKIFGIHLNDAFREWDDDLIVGAVNIWDTVEFLYYLDKVGYNGWLSFDIFPFRMDAVQAVELCIRSTDNLIKIAERIDFERLTKAQASLKAEACLRIIQEALEK